MSGGRGIAGYVERSWSGDPDALAWTRLLLPVSAAYSAAAAAARRRAARSRASIRGLHVVSVGGLTVGGTGKSSLTRWLALEAARSGARAAILLRGYGARRRTAGTFVVPDFDGYPLAEAVDRAGDEASAHRAALPRRVAVAVDSDRYRAGDVARSGYGAAIAVLDDGWEQSRLRWDELWVALDPRRPVGNGSLLPAGPLRRPASTLQEAGVVAFVLEEGAEEVPAATLAWARGLAPRAQVLRFRRVLDGISDVRARAVESWRPEIGPAVLVSAVGSPGRLERFARGAGIEVVFHASFPDHARFRISALERAIGRAASSGARSVLITEKDEVRWPEEFRPPIPVRVIRTSLRALDPVDAALRPLRAAVAAAASIG